MTIFIAEDNPADVYLLRMALEDTGEAAVELIVAGDGEEAMDFVWRRGRFADAATPDLIVLDLNLPKSDGGDILRGIRQSETFRHVPVVVLTSSDSPRDRTTAVKLGANWYLTKPSDLEAFLGLGNRLRQFASGSGAAVAG